MNIDPSTLPIEFGPYQLKQKIASGGMAEIYLAETTGPGGFKKPLVIKMIHHAYSDDKRFLAMFTEEAKIVSSLTHGNIVPIFDFGTAHGLLYLAMEFIDGVDAATLMEVCRTNGITISIEIALHIGIGTAAGLSHAHQAGKGVVHRDVSPQNILLSRSGEVKLCDFGLATYSLEEISTNDAIKGKLKYLSPEQARGEPVDGRSDLFSLGVVIYELIVGHHPIPTGSGVTVLQELAGGEGYPSLASTAPWIPKNIAEIIDKAIAFKKNERYQTGEEMRSALAQTLHLDFREFTPRMLADLVIRVQTEEEKLLSPEGTTDSVLRAKIASFASHTRAREDAEKKTATVGSRKGTIATAGIGLLVAFSLMAWLLTHFAATPETLRKPSTASSPMPHALAVTETDTGDAPDGDTRPSADSEPGRDASPADPVDARVEGTDGKGSDAPPSAVSNAPSKKQPPPVKPARAMGIVHLNASPWADVVIDGVEYTTTPILGLKLKAGKHKAVFVNPELGVTKTRTFTVKADESITVLVEME